MISRRNKSESQKGVSLSNTSCIICGWNKKDYKNRSLTIGAHVRRFENTLDYDKFDNIISLCPNHHIEYDCGNITIDPTTKIIICRDKNDEFNNKKVIVALKHIKRGYLDYHKQNVFKGTLPN